jgi:hypothetical protein
MKKVLLVLSLMTTFTALLGVSKSTNAETFGCQASPKLGDTCTKRVTIRLRKVESEGRDEFDRRFEPGTGWAIQDVDTRNGERGRTGEVSGPSFVEVQAGTITTSSSFVQAQANRVFETIQKGKVQGGNAVIQAFASFENRVRTEFSNIENTASTHQSINRGVQIKAWVAVRGGCRTREPFGGNCINWGPGGSLDTDVIIRLVYIGTNQDVIQIANKYIAEANQIALTAPPPPSGSGGGSSSASGTVEQPACEKLFSSGRSLAAPHTDQEGRTWGGEITISSTLNGRFSDGLNSDNITINLDSNNRNNFSFVRFGGGQTWQGQCTQSSASGAWSNNFNNGRGTFTLTPK